MSIQEELDDALAEELQRTVLKSLERAEASPKGLLVDISTLDVVDTYVARVLAETGKMAKLMGTRTVIVGMRPEVAATLVRMGYPMDGVQTALDVDDGLDLLDAGPPSRP